MPHKRPTIDHIFSCKVVRNERIKDGTASLSFSLNQHHYTLESGQIKFGRSSILIKTSVSVEVIAIQHTHTPSLSFKYARNGKLEDKKKGCLVVCVTVQGAR